MREEVSLPLGLEGRRGEKVQNTGNCTWVWGVHACTLLHHDPDSVWEV